MAMPVLYFDLGSPYAHLAVARAERVLGVAPDLQPVLLGALFQRRDSGSWARTAERAAGMAEVERRAAAYGLPPVRWPAVWPGDGLAVMRAATWARREGDGAAFAHAAFDRAFAQGGDLSDVATIAAVAAAAGLDGERVPAAIADPEVKGALRAATDAAWDAGVRGIPTLRIGERLWFGDDRLDEAAGATAP
ncbi:MAG: DsbA family protein [Solirubrobacterales bacterium]|nr:DsbA family protein [Solirubrobacterales bacterium]